MTNCLYNSEIENIQKKIASIDFCDKQIQEMSGEELLEYYTKKWNLGFLKYKINRLSAQKKGYDLLINFVDPPKTIQQALVLRESELQRANCGTLYDSEIFKQVENEMYLLEEEIHKMWDL